MPVLRQPYRCNACNSTYAKHPGRECLTCERDGTIRPNYEAEIEQLQALSDMQAANLVQMQEAADNVIAIAEHLRRFWDNGSVGALEMRRHLARLIGA